MYIERNIENKVLVSLENNPVVAIVGARQSGKSTLAKQLMKSFDSTVYLDLERPSDLQKLENAEWFLSSQKGKLICIDEIQRKPDLFPLIRSLVDEWGNNGSFLILGSASRDVLRQSSESLAGRISYRTLLPFVWSEIRNQVEFESYFAYGGFPRSLLTKDNQISYEWRNDFISTFLERDLLQWRGFTPALMGRLWRMLAHNNGQTIDYSNFARSLDVSSVTIKNYVDLLSSTFMLEVVPPYFSNLGKRMRKSPKVYLTDSGITAALLGLKSFDDILGHPNYGSIWEQIVLLNLKAHYDGASFYHYRTSNGAEIDFVMEYESKVFVFECKASRTPKLTKGNFNAIEDISPDKTFVVAPINEPWLLSENINVVGLSDLD